VEGPRSSVDSGHKEIGRHDSKARNTGRCGADKAHFSDGEPEGEEHEIGGILRFMSNSKNQISVVTQKLGVPGLKGEMNGCGSLDK